MYTIVGLIGIAVIQLYVNWNLLRKNEKQEDILATYLLYMDNLSKIIEHSAERLNKIDTKGSFKSDDEIGWFFEEVLKIQSRLNNFKLIKLEDGEGKKKEKE